MAYSPKLLCQRAPLLLPPSGQTASCCWELNISPTSMPCSRAVSIPGGHHKRYRPVLFCSSESKVTAESIYLSIYFVNVLWTKRKYIILLLCYLMSLLRIFLWVFFLYFPVNEALVSSSCLLFTNTLSRRLQRWGRSACINMTAQPAQPVNREHHNNREGARDRGREGGRGCVTRLSIVDVMTPLVPRQVKCVLPGD